MTQSFLIFTKVNKCLVIPFLPRPYFIKKICTTPISEVSLVGRNLLKPKDLSTAEIKSLLWTAIDLKQSNEKCIEIETVQSARITLLTHKPSIEIQAPVYAAARFLQTHINIIVHGSWDKEHFVGDTGSFLTRCSDLILCKSEFDSKVEELAAGAKIPVVCLRSGSCDLITALADMMTLQSKYGSLQGLNLGWIGRPCPLINTYLYVATRLGINIQYCCACKSGSLMSPAALPLAKKTSKESHTSLKERKSPYRVLEGADIIVLTRHIPKHSLTLNDIVKSCNKNWSLLHTLPRGADEMTQEIFEHENSLVWEAKGNLQWIHAALIVRLLSHYKHKNKMPEF